MDHNHGESQQSGAQLKAGSRNKKRKSNPDSHIVDETVVLERLPICRRTLKNLRDQGKVPFIRLGRRVLFHWPTVEAALLRHQKGFSSQ